MTDEVESKIESQIGNQIEGTSRVGHSTRERENVPVHIFEDPSEMDLRVAMKIVHLIEERQAAGEHAVLGLPTGSTPIGVYNELIRLHREEGVDFSNVVTFNLDEYYPISPDRPQSYHQFMRKHLFDHVNIPEDQINIPRGDIPRDQVETHCVRYEQAIENAGGIDLMLLGIGRSGHIGFNEPGSGQDTRTRLVVLDEITRKDAASSFFGEENVPREAITVGVGTILDAREVVLMATGEHKAPIVKEAVEEDPTRSVTASFLQNHSNAKFFVDRAAAEDLTRVKTPWLVRDVDWDLAKAKKAVIWLSQKLDKAILRLDAEDFNRNHLHRAVHSFGGVDQLCRLVYEDLRQCILYPTDLFSDERVIVFSPHPDDDVISMGGMLNKLAVNDNDVTVAYMTNGSVAVFDEDVQRHLRFIEMTMDVLFEAEDDDPIRDRVQKRAQEIEQILEEKSADEVGPQDVQMLKALIRYTEAISAIEVMGLEPEDARFLDMPFYKTGRVGKDPIGEKDVQIIFDLLSEVRPSHIFVAGDLSDPHGTHRMCYTAIERALKRYREEVLDVEPSTDGTVDNGADAEPQAEPLVWLYRGAWQEWGIDEADVFLSLSKADLDRKIDSIFKHESQKDRALFPGAYDTREFWERAQDRNTNTAHELDALGLPEFYAVEAFVTTKEM